ncbi:MAG: BMP family ABC transporter substrate-binding protein [Succinivibrio sp.]|jgi:basic membrane protein A|nr:BMP family ABC transporter substrate-binding protein [Succinivibrio sp.]
MLSVRGRGHLIAFLGALVVIAGVLLLFMSARTGLSGPGKGQPAVYGLVLPGTVDSSGWNKSMFEGVSRAVSSAGGRLLYAQGVKAGTGKAVEAVRTLIDRGASTVILGSRDYRDEVSEEISKHPATDFVAFTDFALRRNLSSYWVRVYQISYMAGFTAAMMSRTAVLGYVAGEPDSFVNRNINAFAMGARDARADAKIKVVFTHDWESRAKGQEAASRLIDEGGAEVLSYLLYNDSVSQEARRRKVRYVGFLEDPEKYDPGLMLGMINISWEFLADVIIKHRISPVHPSKVRWYGIGENMVWLDERSPFLTTEVLNHIRSQEVSFQKGGEIFSGLIKDNLGQVRCKSGEVLSDRTLAEKVDWYAQGVEILN